ncbi:MAG TPA: deiodinase-like protein [Gemmataceae bacterium]|nr:deiodinase-like protein [Gemmataceae bacterium]
MIALAGCTSRDEDPADSFSKQKPAVGEPAPDFVLKDVNSQPFHLKDYVGRHFIVLEFGSTTCPMCTQSGLDRREALAKKYRGRVEFAFIYCREAHPDHPFGSMAFKSGPNPSQTTNWPDRAKRAQEFQKQFKIERRLLVDEIGEPTVQHEFGNRDSEIVVVDRAGDIVLKQQYADTKELEDYLDQHCE